MIIGTLGKKSHGKDTISDHLVKNYGYTKRAFADPIKEVSKILFNFTDDQLYGNKKETVDENWNVSPRTVMQYIGTDVFRKDINKIMPGINDDFWVKSLANKIKDTNDNIVISDVRFQNEVDCIHKLGGIVIKVERSGKDNIDQHISETCIDQIEDYDYLINNSGSLEELYRKVDIVMKKYYQNLP